MYTSFDIGTYMLSVIPYKYDHVKKGKDYLEGYFLTITDWATHFTYIIYRVCKKEKAF